MSSASTDTSMRESAAKYPPACAAYAHTPSAIAITQVAATERRAARVAAPSSQNSAAASTKRTDSSVPTVTPLS